MDDISKLLGENFHYLGAEGADPCRDRITCTNPTLIGYSIDGLLKGESADFINLQMSCPTTQRSPILSRTRPSLLYLPARLPKSPGGQDVLGLPGRQPFLVTLAHASRAACPRWASVFRAANARTVAKAPSGSRMEAQRT